MEQEAKEQFDNLKRQVNNAGQGIEFLFRFLNICGRVPVDRDYWDYADFCVLSEGHKGLHKNIAGYTWGFIQDEDKTKV